MHDLHRICAHVLASDPSFWNQPFGASSEWGPDVPGFLRRGLRLLRG